MKMKEREYDVLMFEHRKRKSELREVIKRYDRMKFKRIVRDLVSLSCFKK